VLAGSASAQLRIVAYNTLDKPINALAEFQANTIFGAIAAETVNGIARPVDILLLQEQRTVSGGSTMESLADVLNNLHGTTAYQADFIGFGIDRLAVVYNSSTVDLLDSTQVAVGIRPGYRGHFRPVGYTDAGTDFYTYSAHFKAGSSSSDFAQRANEAINLTNNGASLGQGTNIIYAGDFNLKSATDAAYQNLIAAGDGQAVDPTGATFWNASTPLLMTQSTRTSFLSDGGATGGNDDRFDFQLVTEEVNDGSGFAIITPGSTGAAESSYRAFGNDGVSYNQAINNTFVGRSQPAAVLNALHNFSDHLPVVADYQLPALMQLDATPSAAQAFVGSAVAAFANIQNVAPVTVVAGADELNYSATATGDVIAPSVYNDSADPLAAANTHLFVFDTAMAGAKTLNVAVTSLSDGVADQNTNANLDVFDHANGSLASGSDLNSLTIDFGQVDLGANGGSLGSVFSLFNLESTVGFTSGLSISSPIAISGDTGLLSLIDLTETIAAGDSSSQNAAFDTNTAGSFSAVWEIIVGDALAIAGATTETLTLTLIGEVLGAGVIVGDYNGDGFVSQGDLDLVLLNWGDTTVPAGFDEAALASGGPFDSLISQNELDGVLLNWGNGTPPVAAIPEPASATLLMLASSLLMARGRRSTHATH